MTPVDVTSTSLASASPRRGDTGGRAPRRWRRPRRRWRRWRSWRPRRRPAAWPSAAWRRDTTTLGPAKRERVNTAADGARPLRGHDDEVVGLVLDADIGDVGGEARGAARMTSQPSRGRPTGAGARWFAPGRAGRGAVRPRAYPGPVDDRPGEGRVGRRAARLLSRFVRAHPGPLAAAVAAARPLRGGGRGRHRRHRPPHRPGGGAGTPRRRRRPRHDRGGRRRGARHHVARSVGIMGRRYFGNVASKRFQVTLRSAWPTTTWGSTSPSTAAAPPATCSRPSTTTSSGRRRRSARFRCRSRSSCWPGWRSPACG